MSLQTRTAPADRCPPVSAFPHPLRDAAARAAATFPAERGELTVELAMRHAGRRPVTLRYEWLGERSSPVVLAAGGISADRHVAASDAYPAPGWWQVQCGTGRAIDPQLHGVLSLDWVGADGGIDAPIDPADQADAIAALLDALAIGRLHAFVGCSYGAMVGLQFAARHAERVAHLVAISGCHRAHPYSSAWRALQRRAVTLGALQCDEHHGLELARQLAMLSYRTPEEFNRRFDAAAVVGNRVRAGAEDYLDHCGVTFASRTSPAAFVRLSESIDLQALQPESVAVPATVVAVAEDRLVPIADACELVERLRGETRLRVLHSPYGHDAFLKEADAIDGVLREALAEAEVRA